MNWMDKHEEAFDGMSTRTYNVLRNLDIESGEELANYTYQEILKTKNCGRKTIREIQQIAACYGVKLTKIETPSELHRRQSRIRKEERRKKIILLFRYKDGFSMRQIADIFNVSQTRVAQILRREELVFERFKSKFGSL